MIRTNPPKANSERALVTAFRQKALKVLNSSVMTSRADIAGRMGKSFGGKRDIYTALGYPFDIKYEDYYAKYRRQDIAGRLIDAPVDGSWEQKPLVADKEKNGKKDKDDTEFEKAWIEITNRLGLWNILPRVDKLSRIGQFGVLFIGFSDAKTPEELLQPVATGDNTVQYLQPYGQGSITIEKLYSDMTNPKYGTPEIYSITQETPTGVSDATRSTSLRVHESRVIHIAEYLLESNVYGFPALERVYNRLLNIELIVGGSAEMFWQGAFPGYAFVADGETDMSQVKEDLEAEIDLFVHDFKRYMKLQGLKVEKLSSDVANPEPHLKTQLKMIAIAEGMPVRVLEGSERGELASGQDEGRWNDKLHSRRINFVEPRILRALIDRMIEHNALPAPGKDGYVVIWPDLNAATDKEKADIGKIRAEALKAYASVPDIQLLMGFESFMLEIMRLDKEVVDKIIELQAGSILRMVEDDTDV